MRWIYFMLFILLVIGGSLAYIAFFDINSYKNTIESKMSEAFGHPVQIAGKMDLTKSLMPVLVVNKVFMKNDQKGAEGDNLAVIRQIKIDVDLLSLFRKDIKMKSIDLSDIRLTLEEYENGKNNWDIQLRETVDSDVSKKPPLTKKQAEDAAGLKVAKEGFWSGVKIDIQSITAQNLTLFYVNRKSGFSKTINFPNVRLLKFVKVSGEVVYNEEPIKFNGTVTNIKDLLLGKSTSFDFELNMEGYDAKALVAAEVRDIQHLDNYTINIDAEGENLQKTVMGRLKSELPAVLFTKEISAVPFIFHGALKVQQSLIVSDGSFSLKNGAVVGSFNVESKQRGHTDRRLSGRVALSVLDADISRIYGVQPFSFEGRISSDKEDVYTFDTIQFLANETDFEGNLTISLADAVPEITGELNSRYVSLDDIFVASQNNPSPVDEKATQSVPSSTPSLFSQKKFSLPSFDKVNAKVGVLIENLNVGGVFKSYPRLSFYADVKDNSARLTFFEDSQVIDGHFVGQTFFKRKEQGLSFAMTLIGENFMIDEIKGLDKSLKGGSFDMNMKLTGYGDSVASLLDNVSGQVLIVGKDTEIVSKWLSKLPSDIFSAAKRPYQSYNTSMNVKKFVLNLNPQKGVISLDRNVALESNLLNLVFDGSVDLKTEQLDIQMIPLAPKGKTTEVANVMSQFVKIGGTFLEPKVQVDSIRAVKTVAAAIATSGMSVPVTQVAKKVLEDTNPCQTAMRGTTLKTIDSYLGRDVQPVVRQPQTTQKVAAPKTKAQLFGEDLLESLSTVLSETVETTTGTSIQ